MQIETETESLISETSIPPLKWMTVLKFLLFGDQTSIREIASNRSAFWLGFVFVLSAGFAREYDQENLLKDPWYIFIPLVASMGSSFLLYLIIRDVARTQGDEKVPLKTGYGSFLTLYWMTAPLAWLYAIPNEQLMTAVGSVQANLWTLGLVSFWRVCLMIRIVSVLYQCKAFSALFVVMFFADGLAMGILYFTPIPIINIMGGISLSESEILILGTLFRVGLFGWLSLPIWIVGTLVVKYRKKTDEPKPLPWRLQVRNFQPHGVSPFLKGLSVLSLLFWIPVLPLTQPLQQNRTQAEELLESGQIKEGLDFLSSKTQEDFPRHWTPPPKLGYHSAKPDIKKVTLELLNTKQAEWVERIYFHNISTHSRSLFDCIPLKELNEKQSDQLVQWLKKNPRLIQLIDPQDMYSDDLETFSKWLKAHPDQGKQIAEMIKHEIERYLDDHRKNRSWGDEPSDRDLAYERIYELITSQEETLK